MHCLNETAVNKGTASPNNMCKEPRVNGDGSSLSHLIAMLNRLICETQINHLQFPSFDNFNCLWAVAVCVCMFVQYCDAIFHFGKYRNNYQLLVGGLTTTEPNGPPFDFIRFNSNSPEVTTAKTVAKSH